MGSIHKENHSWLILFHLRKRLNQIYSAHAPVPSASLISPFFSPFGDVEPNLR